MTKRMSIVLIMLIIVQGYICSTELSIAVESKYVASINSEVFHKLDCSYVKRIKEENKIYFDTCEDARNSGRRPCLRCNPCAGEPIPIQPIHPTINHPPKSEDQVRIASWNIRDFSSDSRNNDELNKICHILSNYDFIAVVELNDEDVLKRAEVVLKSMGIDYDYQISDKVGRVDKERYAFLYDRARVEVVETGRIFPDPMDKFIREPYYATFRAGEFDFTAIVIHILAGTTVTNRRAEIQSLADVYNQIQDMDQYEQDLILMGDFNMEPNDVGYSQLRAIPSMCWLFNLPQKSSIFDSSLYDNIWFQSNYLTEYSGECGIYKFDESEFGNDAAAANLAVSDHRPIWADFYIGTSNIRFAITWGRIKSY